MKQRVVSLILLFAMMASMLATARPVSADNAFLSPDSDGDGISNTMETTGWYITTYGPYRTDPNKADTDGDGLSDGEEKLFNVGPVDAKSPGIAVKYDKRFQTIQYFSTSDSKYQQMVRGGDQFLMRTSFVVRRGATFNIIGPSNATLAITGDGLTPLTGTLDPVHGGFSVTIPANGTVGTYTATLTQGTWTKSMPIHVIFELPTDLPANQVAAYVYDEDPVNKKDEVAVWFKNPERQYTDAVCPDPANPDAPCSSWEYRYAMGYTQAFWTEQFTNNNFISRTMPAIRGATSVAQAANMIANYSDREFRVNYTNIVNNFTSAVYRYNDGTGETMLGGGCESTASVFNSMLRSAGIPSRIFDVDYNKTAGHGEPDWLVGSAEEYDHAVMYWADNNWKQQRNYNSEEGKYYPYNSGVTGATNFANILGSGNWYYNDQYGDVLVSVGPNWDFQNGSSGGGMVNTVWQAGPPSAEWSAMNRDYYWDSKRPLEVVQSPNIEFFMCQIWNGDNWAPSEWSTPPTSNPAGRNALQTYILPPGVPDPTKPKENWPYNPQPVQCSASTTPEACAAFQAAWSTTCPGLFLTNSTMSLNTDSTNYDNSIFIPMISTETKNQAGTVQFGHVVKDYGVDEDGDGRFDSLVIEFQIAASAYGEYRFGGWMDLGGKVIRSSDTKVFLKAGLNTISLTFDGKMIADNDLDGPYTVSALWVNAAEEPAPQVIILEEMLAYTTTPYTTGDYQSAQFEVLAATIVDAYTHRGVDTNGNGQYEGITVNVPLNIVIPGSFTVEGDLYDAQGELIGNATWTGSEANAPLSFDIARAIPPFSLEHLYLYGAMGEPLDSRYYKPYTISDMEGKVETDEITFGGRDSGYQLDDISLNNTFTVTPVDTNDNGKYDKLVVNANVTVTTLADTYRIEGVLEDENNNLVAWSVSEPKTLQVGAGQLTLEFDGKMIYDQLPLSDQARSFKLIALRVYNGTRPTSTSVRAQLPYALTTANFKRSDFEPSSAAISVFQDDMEGDTSKWNTTGSIFSTSSVWHSWSKSWMANASASGSGTLALASPLDLTNYAAPEMKLTVAHRMASTDDYVDLEASTDGSTWVKVATFSGTTLYWTTQTINLSAFGENAAVHLRFNAHAQSGLLFYVDDVFVNTWPGVTSASFTYEPQPVVIGAPTTFTASYTSIDTSLPITYTWEFDGVQQVTTTPTVTRSFSTSGPHTVKLTVSNTNDTAITTQTIIVLNSTNQFTLSLDVGTGGTITKEPDQTQFYDGETVILTADSSTGYTFTGWTGACSGTTENICSLLMDSNKTVGALFTINSYTLTVDQPANGSISPTTAAYPHGTVVPLTATPEDGYHLVEWTGACSGSGACSVTMDGPKTVSATFAINTYTLTVTQPENGSIDPVTGTYDHGTAVTLTATPATGYHLATWTGACSSATGTTCSVTMDGDKTVGATFTINTYILTVNQPENGSISPINGTYEHGQSVELNATPANGYYFGAWTGACEGQVNPCTLVMDADKTVSAMFVFVPPACYELTLSHTGNGATPVAIPANSDGCDAGAYHADTLITLNGADPDDGWKITGWTGTANDTSMDATNTVTMPAAAHAASVTYEEIPFGLTIQPTTGGAIVADPVEPYTFGQSVTLTANANPGYIFEAWTGDCSTDMDNACTLVLDGQKTAGATFTQLPNTAPVLAAIGDKTVKASNPLTFTATATDADLPMQTLTYSLATGAPEGAAIDAAAGVFTWTPGGAQPGAYQVTVIVTDSGTPAISDEETFTITVADWSEYWDSYTVGQQVHGVNGWTGWEGNPAAGALVSDAQAHSMTNAIDTHGTTDLVHTYSGYTSGKWVYTAWQYIPTDATGSTYFILMNNYPAAGNNGSWSVQSMMNTSTNLITNEMGTGGTPLPLIKGSWVKIAVEIDLDADAHTLWYNGQQLYTASWTTSGFGTGIKNIGAVDLYANNASPVYYDDMSLLPGKVLTISEVTGGSVTKEHNQNWYGAGESVKLTAVPAEGYDFASWTGACEGQANPCTIIMDTDKTVGAAFDIKQYTLTVTQPDHGSITPVTGQHNYGTVVNMNAIPETGYHFVEWTGACTGSGGCQVTMTEDKQVSAVFAINTFTLTVTQPDNGTISPETSTYDIGTVVELTATPAVGYHFEAWTGACTGQTGPTCSVTMDADKDVSATFAEDTITYTLTVTQPEHGVIAPTSGSYNAGLVVQLTATADANYHFVAWTGACSGTEPTCSVTMDGPKTVSATFAINTYTLTVTQPENGSITPDDGTYNHGENVILTATPNIGYRFTGWTGNLSGETTNPYTLVMDGDKIVGANFEPIPPTCYALTLGHSGEGDDPIAAPTNSTGCVAGSYTAGELIGLSGAAPAMGWQINSWSGTNDDTSTMETNALTMPANDTSVAVNYGQIEYTLNVISLHGLVEITGAEAPYTYNEQVTLTMGAADAGWTFTGWDGGGCTGVAPCSVTITTNTTVTANFTQNVYALYITQAAGGTITVEPEGTYHYGDPVTLTAVANPGYTFSAWTGDCAGQSNPCSLTMDDDKSVSATFTQNEYTLAVVSEHGTVNTNPYQATYTYGQSVVLTMGMVDNGWTFTGWSGGDCSGTDPCTVAIIDNTNVTANFSQDEYSLTVDIEPAFSGTITLSDEGPYNYNDPVTLTPVAAAGWQFDHWMVGETEVTDNPLNITITGNMVVTAYFTEIPYTLTLIASPAVGGTLSAEPTGPTYYYGNSVTVTATPATGYHFVRWEGSCTDSGDCVVLMDGNEIVTAVFERNVHILTINKVGSGTVTADKLEPYYYGDEVTLTAVAADGWSFEGWSSPCSGNGNCVLTMTEDKSVTATFTQDAYSLEIIKIGSGTVAKDPDQETYTFGQAVALTATPDAGWVVSEWSVDGCEGNTCTVTMYGDQAVIVTFTQYIEYTLTISQSTGGTITAEPAGPTYPRNTMVAVTAAPDTGWYFAYWTDDCAGQGNPCMVTMDANKGVSAFFTQTPGKILPKNLISDEGTLMEGFENRSDWTVTGSGSGYKAELDTVYVKEGSGSIKLTTPASGNVTITKQVNWNLSADQGNFRLWVYVSGSAEPSGGSITLYTTSSNYFITSYGGAFKMRYKPGWNLINLRTSDWRSVGTPVWSSITQMRIRLDSRTANTYSFDGLTSGVEAAPAVIFTFDGGLSSVYSQAYSYMAANDVRGTAFIPTGSVGTAGKVTWEQLQTMYADGWTIGSQGMTVVDLTTLDQAAQEAELQGAYDALDAQGILTGKYVAYPSGKYNADTLAVMSHLGMGLGRTKLTFNNVSPLASPFEIAQRTIVKSTSLSAAESWVDIAIDRKEVLVITLQGLSNAPGTSDWYTARFRSLVDYCIANGIEIITMDDLFNLQSGSVTIPDTY